MLIGVGFATSIATGILMPAFVLVFGNLINDFGDAAIDAINKSCLYMVLLGAGIWVATYCYYVCFVILAERIGRKTKVAYLRSLLQ
mmetsp:Transcript_9452/g.8989  ORF Transcript_9452/g.8989 Transcript_9452/m.8989 type:complete len:86 (-) Transcript_9452:34-291(-)